MKRLIDEEDAIRAICKNCYAEDGGDYKDCRYYPCDDVQAIETLPSTDLERIKAIMKKANEQDKHMGRPTDIISRADAIEAVIAEGRKVYTSEYANAERVIYEADAVEALSLLPSADAVGHEVYDKRTQADERIIDSYRREFSEVASAEAEQVTGKLKKPCDSLLTGDSDECKEQKSKLESAETVQGEWIEVEVFPEVYDIEGVKTWGSEMQCDQCGFRHTAIEGHMAQYNFCPNCGAKMTKGGDSE